jgi:hypothetical protein
VSVRSEELKLRLFLGPSPAMAPNIAAQGSDPTKQEVESAMVPPNGAERYRFTGYLEFFDPDGKSHACL